MSFLNPGYLWALSGLMIPIAIHLLSRKEGNVVLLGSLRHVSEGSTRQFRSLRLNEWVLLVLRCLLVVILVFIMSELVFQRSAAKWVVIEPGLENSPELTKQFSDWKAAGYELRWFANDFPEVATGIPQDTTVRPDYNELFRELTVRNPSEGLVFIRGRVVDFKGLRPSLPASLQVIPIADGGHEFIAGGIRHEGGVWVRTGFSSADETRFGSETSLPIDNSVLREARKIRIQLEVDTDRNEEGEVLRAILNTIEALTLDTLVVAVNPSNSTAEVTYDWCFWLSKKEVPIVSSNLVISKSIPEMAGGILKPVAPKQWVLTAPLTAENSLQHELVPTLAVMITYDSVMEARVAAMDRRMVTQSFSTESVKADFTGSAAKSPATPWLVGIFALLWLVERYLAFKRNQ